jgi:exodeoxyribonuclease VII small subunit
MIMSDTQHQDIQSMDFETAFNALQDNVTQLEQEDLSLDDSLLLFERGQALAKHCAALLEQAELKVRTLTMDASDLPGMEG